MTLVITCILTTTRYTSPAVIADLALKHFGACGTLRVNRKDVPKAIKKAKLKAGMDPVFVCQNDVLYNLMVR